MGKDSRTCTQVPPALPTSKEVPPFQGLIRRPCSEIVALDLGMFLCIQVAWIMGLGVDFGDVEIGLSQQSLECSRAACCQVVQMMDTVSGGGGIPFVVSQS